MTLTVEFEGRTWEVMPGDELTFGRAGDVCVDEANLYMHRIVGLVRHRNSQWWLHNSSQWIELHVHTEKGSRHTMASNTRLALVVNCEVRFGAGNANYMVRLSPTNSELRDDVVRVIADAPSTSQFGVIELNDEQRLLLAALCENRLQRIDEDLPPNKDVANRLRWSITKFNRKLDHLCHQLENEGVAGLRGGRGHRASARRENLVDHAVATGLITVEDLDVLNGPN